MTYKSEIDILDPESDERSAVEDSPDEPLSASFNISASNKDNVILATALVKIKDRSGQYVFARALLDSGSQINFVSEELSQRLQLEKEENNFSLVGIGKTNSAAKFNIQATVKSRVNSHKFSSDFWVLRSISGYQPDTVISITGWNILNNIELADPYFFKPQKIDMLIAAEIFFELLCVGQIRRSPDIPSVLGWVVSGKYKNCKTSTNKIVQRFCELEEIPRDTKALTLEHQQCEEKFVESIRQLPSGRFEVSLPFKDDPSKLGCSFDIARIRFLSMERRLSKDLKTKEMYNNFMKEYIELGHMSITGNKIPNSPHYFIPHQCVLRPQSISTKFRDRKFQLILWRESEIDSLEIYKLNAVTYGTKLPIGSKVVRRDFYVDDLLTGADSIEELEVIRNQVTEILQSVGLNRTKWVSNYETNPNSSMIQKNIQEI
ncbi:uncharacterized protein LOC124419914 [Lucilia cuprina]|uniref:uncharacterized protein LOC124419914 n=1 Tax=Lucilia cuprina TaxID=7375 RepID=UPI001F05F1BA|nr:uncharacterized protein LOC124419914 [Lucilia cuprina]